MHQCWVLVVAIGSDFISTEPYFACVYKALLIARYKFANSGKEPLSVPYSWGDNSVNGSKSCIATLKSFKILNLNKIPYIYVYFHTFSVQNGMPETLVWLQWIFLLSEPFTHYSYIPRYYMR